jgi:hypothetical protein
VGVCEFDQTPGFRYGCDRRFLDKNVMTGFEGCTHLGTVERAGRTYVDDVDET